MPLCEGCCSNLPVERKKSGAYAPTIHQLGKKQQQQQQQQQKQQQMVNSRPMSASTSEQMSSSICENSSCCLHRETSGNGNNPSVRFNEGLPTGSTEMLHATNFYQNCVDEDTESRWMEVYEEQRSTGQTSSGTDQENELNAKLSTRSTSEMGNPKIDSSDEFLEKAHSAEPKLSANFKAYLQRCHEMENIDKVAYQG
ncbi:Translation initiation factor [Dirofilaria immitis]